MWLFFEIPKKIVPNQELFGRTIFDNTWLNFQLYGIIKSADNSVHFPKMAVQNTIEAISVLWNDALIFFFLKLPTLSLATKTILCGVLQGTVLGSLLFCICMFCILRIWITSIFFYRSVIVIPSRLLQNIAVRITPKNFSILSLGMEYWFYNT